MEIDDLIYVILLLLFMILGFFNDFKKKKGQQKQQQQSKPNLSQEVLETEKSIPPALSEDQKKRFKLEKRQRIERINREKELNAKEKEFVFQSSMDLTTDFNKESSLGGSIYRNDVGLTYDHEFETLSSYNSDFVSPEMPEVIGENITEIHPLVADLVGTNQKRELVKGFVYGEILKKKY